MTQRPTLETERLILRPFTLADAPDVQRLAGDRAIASTTATIPHPYTDGLAEQWIGMHQEKFERGELVNFAITQRDTGALMGAMSLVINQSHGMAEIGYWLGVPYWGQGYVTEAAAATLRYGFETLGLNRIHARYLTRNPASGRVMQKIGMTYEGCQRQHSLKWGVYEDVALYGILKGEYEAQASASA